MKIVQSTWVRYHHFDLAGELNKINSLERIFTCLPWWKAIKEAREQNIPKELISCNFFLQGLRRMGNQMPFYSKKLDGKLAVKETEFFSKWVGRNLPICDAYFGISGSGLYAGRKAKSMGAGYIMDRGSTQIRYADLVLKEEYKKWNLKWENVNPWLIENEEKEAEESTLITVPSNFVKNTFVHQGTSVDKLRVVPYGVSLKEFYPVDSPKENRFQILFVGQFSIRKGAPYLLEAFKKFQHPNKELIIVGSVPEDMKLIIDTYNDKRIKFVGSVPRLEVKKYMSAAHVMVLPSIEEGLALVQAQAMACGCPIIATPNTGSENLFENGKQGLIIEARSINALKNAFINLADDDSLREGMRMACLDKVKELGGWQTYANGMLKVAKEAQSIEQGKW